MANYSLQIILPRESGTTPDVGKPTLSTHHRTLWAYPLIEYNIRAVVIGGLYPYTYALSNEPTGMTVDTDGVITWTATADSTSSGTVTLTVTDAENTQVTSDWTISVDSTKFLFVDKDAAAGGTGTISSPYNNIDDLNTAAASKIVYFRASTDPYTLDGLTYNASNTKGLFRRVEWNASTKSCQWIAYPGESPVMDFGKALEPVATADVDTTNDWFTVGLFGDIWATGDKVQLSSRNVADNANTTLPAPLATTTDYYLIRVDATHVRFATSLANAQSNTYIDLTDQGTASSWHTIGNPFIRFSNTPLYFDGIRFQNGPNKMLNFVNDNTYRVIRRCTFDTQYGGGDSMNSGMIMLEGNGRDPAMDVSEYSVTQNCTFDTWYDSCAFKIYAEYKLVVEDCTFTGGYTGDTGVCEGLALKGGYMYQATVRKNTFTNIASDALAGNNDRLANAEYCYNNINCATNAIRLNQNGAVQDPVYIYRNTIVGQIRMRLGIDNGNPEMSGGLYPSVPDSSVGPFYFNDNVIINANGANTVPYVTLDVISGETNQTARVTQTNILGGVSGDNIVDANGLLLGTYRDTYLGLRGHEQGTPTIYNRRIRRVRFF